jgi:tetratricopeptide (TPR) repeat protein
MNASDRALDNAMSAFAQSALGGGLPSGVDALIAEAGRLRERPEEALALLQLARGVAPNHPVPLIALYRFHFYGHELLQARAVGEDALAIARTALGPDFGDQPLGGAITRYDAAARFYLFTMKGLAYLNMRLGDLEEARMQLRELRRLDPEDRVGGALLSQVLTRHEAGLGIDDEIDALGAYPARGWTGTQP